MNAVAETAVKALSFGFRDRGGVLQRARATAVVGWCLSLGLVVALYENPIVLAAMAAAVLFTAWRCGVLLEVLFVVAIAAPIGMIVALVNPIASQEGLTVLVAGLNLPLLGTFDITQEAVVYGLILGFRLLVIFAICALYVSTVDPDELLRSLRRFSVRSAITASLAVRFVPVLARDGMNMAIARECRPGDPPSTAAVVRGTFARSLDRASDAAVALETRGYSLARPMRVEQPRRRVVDLLVLASAVAIALVAAIGVFAGLARFSGYPLTVVDGSAADLAFALLLAVVIATPALLTRRIEADEGGGGER